jgi:pimeloyl-ACP methyl ester carboxylesterase
VSWLTSELMLLVEIGLLGLLLMVLLAPLESLGWWAGWRTRESYVPAASATDGQVVAPSATANHYVVFLSGIGEASGSWRFPEEQRFLDRFRPALANAVVIDDIFPYLMTTNELSQERLFSSVWRMVNRVLQRAPGSPIGFLINFRNVLQVMVSVDHRYGPFFNLGRAETIAEALRAHGYPVGSGHPVWLIGYSGGGQVAVGAATYLTSTVGAPIYVISIGGAISSDPGLLATERLSHLYGDLDTVQKACGYLFAGRWPIARQSAWNKALKQGKIVMIPLGPVAHNGAAGYFGEATLPDGTQSVERTVATVVGLVAQSGPAAR